MGKNDIESHGCCTVQSAFRTGSCRPESIERAVFTQFELSSLAKTMRVSEDHLPDKIFTIEEANKMLPLVKVIVRDLAGLSKDIVERKQRIEYLSSGRDEGNGDLYSDELKQVANELEKDARQVHEYARELIELGVEPKSATEGLVDFPCLLDGELVYLCWKLGEDEITHWHRIDDGFAGRKPLSALAASEHEEVGGGSLGS